MTGVLTKSSSGLIFAETAESYPNGWTHAGVGTDSRITTRAHSGAGSFQQDTPGLDWANWPNGWASGDDDKLTQTVNVQSGSARIARIFRALGIVGILYDDFPTTTLDSARWDSSGSVTLASSIATLGSAAVLRTLSKTRLKRPIRIATRVKVSSIGGDWYGVLAGTGNDWIALRFNFLSDGHLQVDFVKNGALTRVDAGVYDVTAYHIYSVQWLSTGAKVYLDGTEIASETTNNPDDSNPDQYYYTSFGPYTGGEIKVDWVALEPATGVPADMWKFSFKIGASTMFDTDVMAETASLDNGFYDKTWISIPAGTTGNQTVELKLRNASAQRAYTRAQHLWDDLVMMLDTQITITSLLGGQKVELLDAGGSVRKSGTCAQTGQDVFLTGIDALVTTAYGFVGYFKVYDTDGVTLLHTTTTEGRFGGDVYRWIPNESKIEISTDYTLIYRAGSGLSPTSALITITLTDKETGDKLNGKTIDWSAVIGTVDPASSDTDANGQASTIFSAGTIAGLGGVRASFAGDATYGPSSILQQIDIYYAAPVIDSSKDFQIFLEGQEIAYSEGEYRKSADFKPQPFRVVGPAFTASTGFWWAVEIYRKGVRDFQGRMFTRKRQTGTNPLITISGVNNVVMLQRRVANRVYQDDPKFIIEDLLTRYPCGATAGVISQYGSVIKLEATYENVYDALVQIKRDTGWLFRLNADNTLDYAPSFGSTKDITVKTGVNETFAMHDEDASRLDSGVFVVGSSPAAGLVSHVEDSTTQLNYGIIEEVFLEKGISEQGTLDLRAQEILDERKSVKETITVDWADTLTPGSYEPFDSLTAEDSDAGLSGLYQVSTITRNLVDANMASLQLVNRIVTLADAMQAIRKDVKDLGVQ